MLKHGPMAITSELVTPEIARKWLALNTGNRRLRTATVEQYARDMVDGNWQVTPICSVCFDDNGILGNGQHTLEAIKASGVAQLLLVARAVPRSSIASMDRGIIRTINDVARFLGADLESRMAGVARIVAWGPADKAPKSFAELLGAYQAHESVVDMVCHAAPKAPGINNPILAVCARAAYSRNNASIHRFLEVLRTGTSTGEHESAAIRLRDFVRSLRGGVSTTELRVEAYNKAMSALAHFLDGRPMSKLYGTQSDLFPIPSHLLG